MHAKFRLSPLESRHIDGWRALYQRSAAKQSWEEAHRWPYSEEVARSTIDDIREKLNVDSAQRILEVGCGCGIICQKLLTDDQKAVGLDLSETLLQRANDFGVDHRRVALVVAEASRLPICDSSFDRVLCYSVFQCFPSKRYTKRVLNELIRVCRPGGVILVGDIFGKARAGLHRKAARIALRWFRMVRLVIRLFISPFKQAATEEEISERYVLRRYYARRFFEKVLKDTNCSVQFLPQDICNRELHNRFDVRIIKGARQKTNRNNCQDSHAGKLSFLSC
jgi:ubiquinone/menaquinone biosynthesis C-methylase UbiE